MGEVISKVGSRMRVISKVGSRMRGFVSKVGSEMRVISKPGSRMRVNFGAKKLKKVQEGRGVGVDVGVFDRRAREERRSQEIR